MPKQSAGGELARPPRLGELAAVVVARDGGRLLDYRRLADDEVDDDDAAVTAAQG